MARVVGSDVVTEGGAGDSLDGSTKDGPPSRRPTQPPARATNRPTKPTKPNRTAKLKPSKNVSPLNSLLREYELLVVAELPAEARAMHTEERGTATEARMVRGCRQRDVRGVGRQPCVSDDFDF